MKKLINKQAKRLRRKARVRARISGTADCPRIAIFRSLRGVSLQLLDDVRGVTLAQANFRELKKGSKNTLVEAKAVGALLGERAVKLGIKQALFDRAGYRYHGKVKAAADGVREAGVAF